MSPIAPSVQPTRRPSSPRRGTQAKALSHAHARRGAHKTVAGGSLGTYLDIDSHPRELFTLPGHGGSVLVLDRDAATLCDRRLVAHLSADEPRENAALICKHYLEDANGRWCRHVRPEDLRIEPIIMGEPWAPFDNTDPQRGVTDRHGGEYRLELVKSSGSTAQLRWSRPRCPENAVESPTEHLSLREVIAALESYEPVRTLTERAIALYHDAPDVSVTRLRAELDRLYVSPMVLNRALREAVLEAIDRGGVSMSEIALRCGIVKRDARGNLSGETSWLARRVGIMPEGGEKWITPWIHSDVLGTIARNGLGICPREVELQ